jgi:archaellum component FlaG (FlaF/FlaG flagellin family)
MGFSLTGATVIFFILSLIVAGVASGVFLAVSNNVNDGLSHRGDKVKEQIDTEFMIINDNENIPNSFGYYNFYLKNIGDNKLVTTNETFQLFIDGELISKSNYYFSIDHIQPAEVTTIYVASSIISSGDHTLRAVGPMVTDDELAFTI